MSKPSAEGVWVSAVAVSQFTVTERKNLRPELWHRAISTATSPQGHRRHSASQSNQKLNQHIMMRDPQPATVAGGDAPGTPPAIVLPPRSRIEPSSRHDGPLRTHPAPTHATIVEDASPSSSDDASARDSAHSGGPTVSRLAQPRQTFAAAKRNRGLPSSSSGSWGKDAHGKVHLEELNVSLVPAISRPANAASNFRNSCDGARPTLAGERRPCSSKPATLSDSGRPNLHVTWMPEDEAAPSNPKLSLGWSVWYAQWENARRRKQMMMKASAVCLAKPKLAAAMSHRRKGWQAAKAGKIKLQKQSMLRRKSSQFAATPTISPASDRLAKVTVTLFL